MNEHENSEKPDHSSAQPRKKQPETNLLKTKTLNTKDLRKRPVDDTDLNELDETFSPTYIPHTFVKAVKPFLIELQKFVNYGIKRRLRTVQQNLIARP